MLKEPMLTVIQNEPPSNNLENFELKGELFIKASVIVFGIYIAAEIFKLFR